MAWFTFMVLKSHVRGTHQPLTRTHDNRVQSPEQRDQAMSYFI